jgi:hypothetical protein
MSFYNEADNSLISMPTAKYAFVPNVGSGSIELHVVNNEGDGVNGKVYDSKGNRVRDVELGNAESITYLFDGLPSGLYMVVVKIGGVTDSIKTLVK